MKRLALVMLLIAAPVSLSFDAKSPVWRFADAHAQQASAKEAFEAARELGTIEAWEAFLASYPNGFYADLARAYLRKLAGGAPPAAGPAPAAAPAPAPRSAPAPAPAAPSAPAPAAAPAPAPAPAPATREANPIPGPGSRPNPGEAGAPPAIPGRPVARGGQYMGFAERFNRYYTDPTWKPSRTVFVSPERQRQRREPRRADAGSRPRSRRRRPGTQIYFLRGAYQGCFELTKANSGTYDEPIVLYGERNPDQIARRCDHLLQQRAADLLQPRSGRLRRGRRLRADRRPLRRARDRRGLRRRASTRAASR